MKKNEDLKNKYATTSSETLMEFEEEWDYETNPHPTAADYLVWLVQKSLDAEAEEITIQALESLGEDGVENKKAIADLQEIENKKKALQETIKTFMTDTEYSSAGYSPFSNGMSLDVSLGTSAEDTILNSAVNAIKQSIDYQVIQQASMQASESLRNRTLQTARQTKRIKSIDEKLQDLQAHTEEIQKRLETCLKA